MLTEFDQSTIANMTAALDFVCKKIGADTDSNELRKRVADELVRCARSGRRSLIDLKQAELNIVAETAEPRTSNWFKWWRN
jgi:hypothetical protein